MRPFSGVILVLWVFFRVGTVWGKVARLSTIVTTSFRCIGVRFVFKLGILVILVVALFIRVGAIRGDMSGLIAFEANYVCILPEIAALLD